jgi:hypothetical protein
MRSSRQSISLLLSSLLLSAVVGLAAGCASRPEVRRDQDPAADLKAYQTFAFYEHAGADTARYSTLLSARLKSATRRQLEQHNYLYDETDPDLRVNVFLNVAEKQEVRSVPGRGFHGYRSWSGIETADYRLGTLGVDLVDARRNALVWQGVAQGRLGEQSSQEPGRAIDAAVSEIFAGFPAGKAR